MSLFQTTSSTGARRSAIAFAAPMRPHIALAVSDVEAALPFYEALLGVAPTKVRPGYAKFEPAAPALNLSLNLDPDHAGHAGAQHFGIQVQDSDAVEALGQRVLAAGFSGEVEEGTVCCYARQDKVWLLDPDGHRWEIFVVTEADNEAHSLPSATRMKGEAAAASAGANAGTAASADTAASAAAAPCCTPKVALPAGCCG